VTVTSEFLVALIAGFASDVELYLLDEPTSGLDPLVVRPFHEVVEEPRSAGSTVLLSSHVLAEVEALCDRVSIIRDGVVVESGSLAELRHLTRSTVEAETEAPVRGHRDRPRRRGRGHVTRRDLGAGLVPARPGAARAGRWLASPVGLLCRLQRGVFVGWALAMTVVGAAFGAVGDSADELVGISEDLALALEGLADGSLVELYFAFAVGFLAIAASGFGVQAALRLRAEGFGGRTEAVLATGVSRRSCSRTSPRCLPRRGRGRRSWRCSRSPWW
jgi:hypothetical protein